MPNIVGAAGICKSPKPPMLCEGLLPSTGIYLVAGAPGVSKTWFSLECALTLTAKVKGFGRFTAAPSKALYIGEDSPAWDVGAMLGKLLRGHGITPAEPDGLLFGVHQGFHLNDASGMQALADCIEQYMCEAWQDSDQDHALVIEEPKGLVIIDNLRKIHSKKESSSDEMVMVMDRLRLLAKYVCVMVLHHPAKPGEFAREEWADMRGSGEIVGGCDAVMFLKRKSDVVAAKVIRARAAMPVDFNYQIEDEGDVVRLVAVEDSDEFLAELKGLCGVSATLDRKEIYQLMDDKGYKGTQEARRRKVSRMLQTLLAEGVIRRNGINQYKSLKYNGLDNGGREGHDT